MEQKDIYTVDSLNEDQRKAFDLINDSSDNFYVTGKAGTGKSYLLQTLCTNTMKKVAIVAPTGIAAINVGGQTIHSFFGMGTSIQAANDQNMVQKGLNEKRRAILNDIDVLIIDEVSMVRVDVMDMIDAKLRMARNKNVPFGGCQIITFGDLYQLPPVVEDHEVVTDYFEKAYNTIFFFGAPVVLEKPFKIIELSQVVRQKDPEFVEILNAVREGDNDTALIEKLNTRNIPAPVGNECITLVTSNSAASIINHRKLEELDTEEYLYTGLIEGTYEKDDLPTNMILCLKEGAQVILLKNNPGKWVNGTIGKIVKLEQNQIIIQTPDGEFPVGKEMWTKYEYQFNEEKKQMERVPVGYFTHYPLTLSYAITIHKSQGQTYECVEVDYSVKRAFAPGQTYVALSRCKHFSSLYLTVPMIQDDIKADEEVVRFMHGEFEARPRSNVPAPIVEHTRRPSEYRFRDDHRIEAKDFGNHKKITGTRLANILNMTEKISPFAMWCAMMHVYEEPYKDTIFTRAGETIEPKQFEYVKKLFAKEGRVFISPTDRYGEEYKLNTHYDFFRQTERFGGMWDYLLERDNKVVMVFEMKTTGIGNKEYWMKHLPKKYIIQAALYAWLLKIDYFCMVCSFLEKDDYDAPENYECNEENTITRIMKVSEYFQDFDKQIIVPAMQWWDDYIETGISPEYDEVRDHDILEQLRKGPDEEEIDEDEYYDQLAEYHGYRNDGFISSSRDLYSLHLDKNYHDMTYYKRKKQDETDN